MCGEIVDYEVKAGEAGKVGTARTETACPCPDGLTTVVTLPIPSGKMIITDDLRDVYHLSRGVEDSFFTYNSARGQAQVVEAMAKLGCAYGPVGNTCPGLYRVGEKNAGAYVITTFNHEYDDEGNVTNTPSLPESDRLAGIITDLWAYSAADYEDWQSKGGTGSDYDYTVVNVEPGTYEFTLHTGEKSFNRDAPGTVVLADVRRV